MSTHIFNEPTNARIALETTASEAHAEAPNARIAGQVEKIADRMHTAAEHAAKVAKVKGPELTGESISAVEQLQAGAGDVTINAIVEGERDIENAKAAGASYLDQAKALASSAIATAQSYLSESLGSQTTSSDIAPHTKAVTDSISSTLQSGVDSAIEKAKQYAITVQGTMQSQAENAKGVVDTAKQQAERAKGAAQELLGPLRGDIDNLDDAPLEHGQGVATRNATKIAAAEP